MNASNLTAAPVPKPAEAPAAPKTRTRKPSAKTGLVAELQAKLREARKIDKATAIVKELSRFGIEEVANAVRDRSAQLDPK